MVNPKFLTFVDFLFLRSWTVYLPKCAPIQVLLHKKAFYVTSLAKCHKGKAGSKTKAT